MKGEANSSVLNAVQQGCQCPFLSTQATIQTVCDDWTNTHIILVELRLSSLFCCVPKLPCDHSQRKEHFTSARQTKLTPGLVWQLSKYLTLLYKASTGKVQQQGSGLGRTFHDQLDCDTHTKYRYSIDGKAYQQSRQQHSFLWHAATNHHQCFVLQAVVE